MHDRFAASPETRRAVHCVGFGRHDLNPDSEPHGSCRGDRRCRRDFSQRTDSIVRSTAPLSFWYSERTMRPRPLPNAAIAPVRSVEPPDQSAQSPLLGGRNARATSRRDPSNDYNSRSDYSRNDSVGENQGRGRCGDRPRSRSPRQRRSRARRTKGRQKRRRARRRTVARQRSPLSVPMPKEPQP